VKKNLIIGIFLTALFAGSPVFSQETSQKYNRYFAKDQLSFAFISSQWISKDLDVEPSVFSRGVNFQMMYPVLGEKRNVALALGFGYAAQNYYLKHFIQTNSDSLKFTPIPDSLDMKKYKLNTNYLTFPIELRFRTNPDKRYRRSVKIYAGFRTGILVNVHTKYMGRDPITNEKVKEKSFYIDHIAEIDYGLTLRVGYGKFMVHSYYSLSNLIDPGKGPTVTPIEVGIAMVLF